ncbi:hypothetical protein [Sphingomonas sp.]|uniref:hypothetical protein n=1 Tax=Sphingomonas sp. TaxID=28214 RepID=UPI00286E5427|nr:hypothetical protein [Sphingomonas sp.]
MRKQMIENAAFDVAAQVRAVEDTIDAALAEIAELQGRMMRARSLSGVGIATGHEALEKLAGTVTSLVGARGSMAACHAALIDAKGRVPGLRTVSFGDGEECPPPKSLDRGLRVVA